jgi:hypothetical protein
MATVDVLMVVDVEGALAGNNGQGDLQDNIYLVDTNKYMGSGAEGQAELVTSLNNSDTIVWSVAPVAPDTNVTISSFGGIAIANGNIKPVAQGASWTAQFTPGPNVGAGVQFQYTATLQFDGQRTLTFDPFLSLKNAT